MPKKYLFLCIFFPGLVYCGYQYWDNIINTSRNYDGIFNIIFISMLGQMMSFVTIAAYAFSQIFGEKESEVTNNNAFDLTKELAKLDKLKSEVNKGTLETNNNALDLTTELAKLDKLKKDGLITAEDYEVLKKRAIEKAK